MRVHDPIPMTPALAEALGRDVSERTRTKNRYFLGGAVRAIEGSATHVLATVRGSGYAGAAHARWR